MATTFKIPSSPSKSIFQMSTFQGCDFTNSPANVDELKSPNCVNMIRDVPGKVRKSMGWHTIKTYPDKINGAHYFRLGDEQLIHSGEGIYCGDLLLYKNANDERSKSWQIDDKLFIQDGKKLLVYVREKAEDSDYDRGSKTFEVEGIKYTNSVKIQDGTTVTYKFPYKAESMKISYNGTSTTIDFDEGGVDEYEWTNDLGSYQFTIEFTSCAETKNVLIDGLAYTDTFGKGTILDFASNKYKEVSAIYYDEDGNSNKVIIKKDYEGSFSWENTIGDVELSIYSTATKGEWLLETVIGTNRTETYSLPDLFVVEGQYIRLYQAIDLEEGLSWYFTDEKLHTIDGEVIDVPEVSEGMIMPKSGFLKAKLVATNSNTVIPQPIVVIYDSFATYGKFTYQNTLGLSGELKRAIGADFDGDFVDATNQTYVASDGYIRKIHPVEDDAYIPTLTIAKPPSGGGTDYEPLNLLQPAFIELFQPSEIDPDRGEIFPTAFHLSFDNLDNTPPIVKTLNASGGWDTKTLGTHYTVDYARGIINFKTSPGASPITGEDSVSIQAYRTVEGYADRINKSTISIMFGVNGNPDRLFVSGNKDFINYDWYSELNDPTYFADTHYSVLGTSSSAIVGYTTISNYLAACKDDMEIDSNIILREGNLTEDQPSFPIVATLQGSGAVAPWSFQYLQTEPIFLTKDGIFAVTAQDITGEKYAQNRSYFLDGKLKEEENLENGYSVIFNNLYWLCLNGKCYILDGLQSIRTDKSMPYATRQYAGFYRENIPANCMWVFNENLFFGTEDGKVCEFYTDKNDPDSYNDDGEPIKCCWETPDLDGKYFFKNKTFRYIAVRLDSAIATSLNIYTMKRGIWNLAKNDSTKARYFLWSKLNFDKFSFSTDRTQKIIHTKLRLKKVDKARFRFSNEELNEPFGLYDIALEYVERGNYKG